MSVSTIFKSMDYGPAPESDENADAWLAGHKRNFDLFIGGKWVKAGGGLGQGQAGVSGL